jgi:serine/threonine protein kinase
MPGHAPRSGTALTESGADMVTRAAAAQADVAAGLAPELEIVRALGGGSTADVYLAREPALERLVAVKVLLPELASDRIVRRRFEREAQAAARVTHPHVTVIHRVGRLPGDVPYIVMEYVEGRTVRDCLDSVGPFDAERGRTVLAEIAAALAATHERRIAHRDVQPGNVFIEHRTGRAVLGDFGIAALLETAAGAATRLTGVNVRLGALRYMSPEQLRGEPVTEQSDVYAFGMLAYEVLANASPFEVSDDAEYVKAHLERRPRPLHRLRPDLDEGVARLLERSLAKEPNRRPRAAELAARLADPGAGEPVERGPFGAFFLELRRRRVYQTAAAYTLFVATTLSIAQFVFDALDVERIFYRLLVLATLAGLPVTLVFAWIYDIGAGGIRRTEGAPGAWRLRWLVWLGLAASVVAAAAVAWLLLRND